MLLYKAFSLRNVLLLLTKMSGNCVTFLKICLSILHFNIREKLAPKNFILFFKDFVIFAGLHNAVLNSLG